MNKKTPKIKIRKILKGQRVSNLVRNRLVFGEIMTSTVLKKYRTGNNDDKKKY